eukprot:scaffold375_cov157-Amphora_coffeaeformis.AAC.4
MNPPPSPQQEEKKEDVAEARSSLLKVLLEHQFKPKFSSTPLRAPPMAKKEHELENEKGNRNAEAATENQADPSQVEDVGERFEDMNSSFTRSERKFLEEILKSGEAEHISAVEAALKDPTLFPNLRDEVPLKEETTEEYANLKRRDSLMQQRLFHIHQNAALKPSDILQRMSFMHRNSLLEETFEDAALPDRPREKASLPIETTFSADSILADDTDNGNAEGSTNSHSEFDFFQGDLPNWLDGNQGVEVDDTGEPLMPRGSTNSVGPFRILGTSANDASCHPHVLSPPLMEALLNFVPETLSNNNFWLKYSVVRDGANLLTMLRHVRSSTATLLAIETTEGHVFGSFTAEAWRLAQGWYGTREAFLWKMRRTRAQDIATTPASIYQQAMQESEIQVFPYRTGSMAVQYCSKECLMLGRGEVLQPNNQKSGKHYGHGLYLEANLMKGSTSTSETFGNPCLVDDSLRGSRFQVANMEIWTLTPHATINEAQRSEFASLFLEGNREEKDLNLLGILVGGSI